MRRALLLASLLAIPGGAAADAWVSVSGGVYAPTSTVSGLAWETRMTASIQGGYDLEHVGASLGLSVLSSGAGRYLVATAWPIVVRLRARLPAGLVAPYAYGGVGVAPSRATLRAFLFDATALVGQAGAGVEFTLRDGLFVGIEAGYAWARPAFSFGTLTLDGFVGQVGLGMRF
jgi:hypothetical protein